MIERLQLKNFQGHQSLSIDFDSAITTIVGPSDIGKSAIVRALRWLCFNKPDGDAFVRQGSDGAKVRLVADGRRIVRTRVQGENSYTLDGEKLVSFGRGGVPDRVAEVLQLDEVNFQQQHDSPFWFSMNGGEISRQLNSIVDLGVVDSALSHIQKKLRDSAIEAKAAELNLNRSKEALKSLDHVPRMVERFKVLEGLASAWESSSTRLDRLQELVRDGEELQQVVDRTLGIVAKAKTVRQSYRSWQQTRDRIGGLRGVLESCRTATTIVRKGQPDFSAVESKFEKWSRTKSKLRKLSEIYQNHTTAKELLCRLEAEHRETVRNLPQLVRCAECGSLLKA